MGGETSRTVKNGKRDDPTVWERVNAMTTKPKIKRLSSVKSKLSPEAKAIRKRYTRVQDRDVGGVFAYRPVLHIDHQEFKVYGWTDRASATWFADQLAIALARLVENERATGTTGAEDGSDTP
jgi:hypothetical protein